MVEWSKNGGFPFFSLNNIDFFVGKDILIPVGRRERFLKFYQNKAPVVPRKNQFFGLGLRLFRFEKWGNTMVGKLTQRLHKSKNGKKGFTLVELIVVIVIILILAAVMVPLLMNYIGQANQANAKSNASTVLTQIQADYAASQASSITGITEPGQTGNNKVNNVNVAAATAITDANKKVSTTQGSGTAPNAAYGVKKATTTGKTNYSEIVAFVYDDGSYTVTWTQDAGWAVSNSSNAPTATVK